MASNTEVVLAGLDLRCAKWDHLTVSEPGTQHLLRACDRTVVHDGTSFRLMDYRCRLPVATKAPEESSKAHQIVFVRSGLFVLDTPRGRVVADANHVLFFNAYEPYTVSHPVPGGDNCLVLVLSDQDRHEMLAAVHPKATETPHVPFPFTHALSMSRTALLQRRLLSLARICATKLEMEETALELAEAAVRDAQPTPQPYSVPNRQRTLSSRRSAIEAVKVILASNVAEPPCLRDLARRIGYSPFHLVRTFRAEVGLPIRRYLARLRLRLAVERLAEDGEDLTGLALDLGYADHSHFTNAFRREFGTTPSQLRSLVNLRHLRSQPD
jgi:AraC family transcriptional regulator